MSSTKDNNQKPKPKASTDAGKAPAKNTTPKPATTAKSSTKSESTAKAIDPSVIDQHELAGSVATIAHFGIASSKTDIDNVFLELVKEEIDDLDLSSPPDIQDALDAALEIGSCVANAAGLPMVAVAFNYVGQVFQSATGMKFTNGMWDEFLEGQPERAARRKARRAENKAKRLKKKEEKEAKRAAKKAKKKDVDRMVEDAKKEKFVPQKHFTSPGSIVQD